jgi:small subunit ribosomal protein S17
MADETPNDETVADAPEAPEAADAAAETATEAPTGDGAATEAGDPTSEAAPAAEPQVMLTPKERKAAARARRGRRRPATPEERAEARKAKKASRARWRAKQREKKAADRAENGPRPTTPPKEHGEGRPKVRQGTVVSDKADKTITVRVDVARRHRRYEKIVRSSVTFHAHDETNEANTGDTVRIVETRPMSATKRWRLDEVLERAK